MMINQQQLELQQDATASRMDVDNPKTLDFLCGRGKMCFCRKANDGFLILIAVHAIMRLQTKKVNVHVVALVVDIVIARGGPFSGHLSPVRVRFVGGV